MRHSKRFYGALSLAAAAAVSLWGQGSVQAAPGAAPAEADKPLAELAQGEQQAAAKMQRLDASVNTRHMVVTVRKLHIQGEAVTKAQVLQLLPELKKDKVNIGTLSRQVQYANDNGAAKLHTTFVPHGSTYEVTVQADPLQQTHYNFSVANSGNSYTGDWRTTAGWLETGAGRGADTVGAAIVSSPGHWSDVKQAAFAYKMVLPKMSDSFTFSGSWSDVQLDMAQPSLSGLQLDAGGKGATFGLHYQHAFSYSSRNKDILDLGIDHKHSTSDQSLYLLGNNITLSDYSYDVDMVGVTYRHNDRDTRHTFSYEAGYAGNIRGNAGKYAQVGYGNYSENFGYVHGGLNYQYRTGGDWLLGLRAQGQYTRSNVLPIEQLGAGGQHSVRGFDERIVAADTGVTGSVEVYTPEIAPKCRLVLFSDAGWLHNNNTQAIDRSLKLASAGLGFRYLDAKQGVAFTLDYAKPVTDLSDTYTLDRGHKLWNTTLSFSF